MFPTIAEYNQVIQSNRSDVFRTLNNLLFIPSRTTPVKIYSYGSGSYAVVFKAKDQYNEYAIRCFISAEQENIDRYRSINNYLKQVNATWITNLELLENEINISGKYYPIIKMNWVEGKLLNEYIEQILNNNKALTELQEEIIKVSHDLEAKKIGHGDIQCGNIIVNKDISSKSIIKLIDYDGMYIPAFSSKMNLERGRTEFQHPNRSQAQYNEKIDRFSFWVILCALEALKYDKSLWLKVMQDGYNTLDNVLFTGNDFINPESSKLFTNLLQINAPALQFYVHHLIAFCKGAANNVKPLQLYSEFNTEVVPIASNNTLPEKVLPFYLTITSSKPGAAILTSTFEKLGSTPMQLDTKLFIGKTLLISNGSEIKRVIVQPNQSVINILFEENQTTPTLPSGKNIPYQNNQPVITEKEPVKIITPQKQNTNSKTIIVNKKKSISYPYEKGVLICVLLITIYWIINRNNSNHNHDYNSDDYSSNNSMASDSSSLGTDTFSMIAPTPIGSDTSHLSSDSATLTPITNSLNFFDSFDDNSNYWPLDTVYSDHVIYISKGNLVIGVYDTSYMYATLKKFNTDIESEYTVSTNVLRLYGQNSEFGLTFCSDSTLSSFFCFFITEGGRYSIIYYDQKTSTDLSESLLSNSINHYPLSNNLTIHKNGDMFEFYINNDLIKQLILRHNLNDRFGMIVNGHQTVEFNNFNIYAGAPRVGQ